MKKFSLALFGALITNLFFGQYNFNQIEIWEAELGGSQKYMEEMNGYLYFQGYSEYQKELWRTDGTQAGTELVADLNAFSSSSPASLKAFNNLLFFTAGEIGYGTELYRTDGTSEGTFMLQDIRPGTSAGFESSTITFNGDQETFMEFNNELFFFANTGDGIELWKTDGSIDGTVSVKNFNPGMYAQGKYNQYNGNQKENLGVVYNGELYFIVKQQDLRYQLWKSDGTTAGTTMVRGELSEIKNMIVMFGEIYFSSSVYGENIELWTSDGTLEGTNQKIDLSASESYGSSPEEFTIFNGELFFTADGIDGREIYRTDGENVTMVKDIFTGQGTFYPNSGLSTVVNFFEYSGYLYFRGTDETVDGFEMWRTDGTTEGTTKVITFDELGVTFIYQDPVLYDGKMFFQLINQLWYTDGTALGTEQITDNGDWNEPISQVRDLLLFQDNLWFAGANNYNGVELWYLGEEVIIPTNIEISACSSYTVPSGDETYSISGIFMDTIPNSIGGDSILQIELTILEASYSTIEIASCNLFTSPSGNYTWYESGAYQDILVNTNGCDSIITINLIISVIDASISLLGSTLQANNSTATYQWLDCSNDYEEIIGETGDYYIPTQTGSYAVQVTESGCSEISECEDVLTIGIENLFPNQSINIYPNPTNRELNIELLGYSKMITISIYDATGRIINQLKTQNEQVKFDFENEAGVYIILLEKEGQFLKRMKFVKE